MDRRKFIQNSGLSLGALGLVPALNSCESKAIPTEEGIIPSLDGSWESVRKQFIISHKNIQMAQMLLASHPAPVRAAIEMHRKKFDESPAEYWEENHLTAEPKVLEAAAKYLQCKPEEIALTDSTTQGLGTLYTSLKIKAGDEILTTTHDHYATEKSLEYAAQRNGATIKRIDEYADPFKVTVDEVVSNLQKNITDKTRIIAVTWVHSCTGVKLPIADIGAMIQAENKKRNEDNRIYFCVDGVHGFGVENISIEKMNCDFFCAGTHKWIFGPRGTGIVWGRKDAWDMVVPVIPAFTMGSYGDWLGLPMPGGINFSDKFSPGGFHAFEHRWSLNEAFMFQLAIGKEKIQNRVREFSGQVKAALLEMDHIKLYTPLDENLSAGINCFEVKGQTADETVNVMHKNGVIGSATPYRTSYARLTPCVINTPEEVQRSIQVMEGILA